MSRDVALYLAGFGVALAFLVYAFDTWLALAIVLTWRGDEPFRGTLFDGTEVDPEDEP